MAPGQLEQFRLMARYNRWMNGRLYELATELSDEERRRDLGAFFGSIHATFNHLVLTDRIWLARFAEVGPARDQFRGFELVYQYDSLAAELYEDFGELRAQREATDELIERWTRKLHPADLDAKMIYANSKGLEREHPLWFGMAHFFNHQTHHRGQLTTLFMQLGKDPGLTDFLVMHHLR